MFIYYSFWLSIIFSRGIGRLEEVAQLRALRLQVFGVVEVGWGDDGHYLHHLQPVAFQSDDLPGVVGEQADFLQAQFRQDLSTNAIVPQVGRKAQ